MKIFDDYKKNGFVGPLEIMSREDALTFKDIVLKTEEELNLMKSQYRCKSNVLFPFVDEISRNSKVIDYVSQIIGPNFHCWDTLFWIKHPGDGRDVSFHQDATYWNFDNKHKAVTVWFAFDDVTPESGSIEYIAGSHHAFQKKHKDIKSESNLLMRGQTVDMPIIKERVKTSVGAGQALIHSPYIIHGSPTNNSQSVRVAMGMIFVSTECKPILNISPESTVMISGVDVYNYMQHDPRPSGHWRVDLQNWKKAYDRQHINYYQMQQLNLF